MQTPQQPPTRKGELRVEIETLLDDACARGMRLCLLRGGDFFGEGGASTWASFMLGKALNGGKITWPTALSTRHQFAYLPDFAQTHAALLAKRETLPARAIFHFEGHVVDGHTFVRASAEALGDLHRKSASLPWWGLQLAGLFSAKMREVAQMRYLWDEEVLMSQRTLQTVLPEPPKTDLVDALRRELATQRGEVVVSGSRTAAA